MTGGPAAWGRVRAGPLATLVVVGMATLLGLPRHEGPIDLRWDGGVYYVLGTSLAAEKGYRLLNEPGEIAAVQYPPLLPAIVAAHEVMLGTSDPTIVGRWLRLSSFAAFVAFAIVVLRFLSSYLPPGEALVGALVSLLGVYAWFLSDALYPEVLFGVATILFLMFARGNGTWIRTVAAYVCALASYALRTVGIVAFVVWALDSLLRRRFRQAALRILLAGVPVLAWQSYVVSVERSYEYAHPAYEYQRAPYLFSNVSYARNLRLRDPFTPEKGEVRPIRRVVRNMLELPAALGEALSVPRRYLESALSVALGGGPIARRLIREVVFTGLSVFGLVLVAGGVGVQLLQKEWLAPLYIVAYMAALSLTPFPRQDLRYLMPITPVVALAALRFLRGPFAPSRTAWLVFAPVLLIQAAVAAAAWQEHRPVSYVDRRNLPVAYELFFYDETSREFDEAVDFLRGRADPSQVVAAGGPQWIYLRTGLKAVMPPLERDVFRARDLLDSVPVAWLVIGRDAAESERYTIPVVNRFPDLWQPVYTSRTGIWTVYRRKGCDTLPTAPESRR